MKPQHLQQILQHLGPVLTTSDGESQGFISEDVAVLLNVSPVTARKYLRNMVREGWVALVGHKWTGTRSPPLGVYMVTPAGRAAYNEPMWADPAETEAA